MRISRREFLAACAAEVHIRAGCPDGASLIDLGSACLLPESLAGFRNTLPPSLEIAETANLRRGYGRSLLDLVFGSTPWGLCDVAVVTPKGQAGALGEHPGSARRR